MKRIKFMITAVLVITGFAACTDSERKAAKQDTDNLTVYVDSVENAAPVYTTANWTEIDNGYQERVLKAEKTMDKLEADDKARAEASKAKYAALKADYEAKIKAAEASKAAASDYRVILRNRLFGEGKVGADMKFDYVTAGNIVSVYENFVNAVEARKNDLTKEDWDEVKILYDALNARKHVVDKDLSAGDNLKITGLKIKLGTMKAVHKPWAEEGTGN
jgi:hypothetical protein